MLIKRSHFRFTHRQRNGIFFLLFLIIGLQSLYYYISGFVVESDINDVVVRQYQTEIDSLRKIALQSSKPKITPFNPNFITDFKGYTLGMTNEEIDRLLTFRENGKWINSAREFQRVTKVSDSLLKQIKPFFKFPDWVNSNSSSMQARNLNGNSSFKGKKIDLNKATALDLQEVNGVGPVLSERIIRFRNSFPDGFIHEIQLIDVYGLSESVLERLYQRFEVKSPRIVEKFALNKTTVEQLVQVQHIDYELAYAIINERSLREGFKSWEELTKVKDFPAAKIDIIRLYLTLD
ncbi:MAG: helix-hairpin-helix domain-containing protein [Bacteroidia bacterium]|nr:helix-hairpin-helix domain-containing protein [Bacteroidia bacterium]